MSRLAIIAAGALLVSASTAASASSVTFGQFFQKNTSSRLFRYKNKDVGATRAAEIYTISMPASQTLGSIPVFYVMGGGALPVDLTGPQNALLKVDFFSSHGTTGNASGSRVQLFDSGTITLTRTSAALEGLNSRTNLLTVTFTNAELDASQNNGSFTFKSNANSVITYTSDFMNFANVLTKDFSLSFSGSNPTFQSVIGKSAKNMTFSGTGTFASDPAPITIGAPEASTWAMLVLGFGGIGALMRSGRRSKDLFAA
jgi:hypothetical protein